MKRYVSQSIIDEILQSESKETRIKDFFKLYGKFVVFMLLMNILMIFALVKGISPKSVIPSIGILIFEIYYSVRFYLKPGRIPPLLKWGMNALVL